jgi:peptide methionine sulfoxide reductase MsrB
MAFAVAMTEDALLPKTGGQRVMGSADIMCAKAHGSSASPVQRRLRWGISRREADYICCFNRHFAEPSGAWAHSNFTSEAADRGGPTVFYDSVTGKPLFVAPLGRELDAFMDESTLHGWPSFRDSEVVWENVRVLPNGETVSLDGTHLGHNLPDSKGNRYCINLCSVAGSPPRQESEATELIESRGGSQGGWLTDLKRAIGLL